MRFLALDPVILQCFQIMDRVDQILGDLKSSERKKKKNSVSGFFVFWFFFGKIRNFEKSEAFKVFMRWGILR